MSMTRSIQSLVASACVLLAEIYAPVPVGAVDQLADLGGKAAASSPCGAEIIFRVNTAMMCRSVIIPWTPLSPIPILVLDHITKRPDRIMRT